MILQTRGTDPQHPAPRETGRRRAYLWAAAAGVCALALAVRSLWVFVPGFEGDQIQFVIWSEKTQSMGLAGAYTTRSDGRYWCNYPPCYLYPLRVLAEMYNWLSPPDETLDESLAVSMWRKEDTAATRRAVALYKLPAVLADAVLGALLTLWLAGRIGLRWAAILAILYVLMPAVVHNSTVWGQIDAIPTLLAVASLETARRRKMISMCLLATLAILTKAQALVLLPIWLAAVSLWSGRRWRRWLAVVGVVLGVSTLLLLPFRGVLPGVWESYAGASRYYPYTHLNGFSAWFLGHPLTEPQLETVSRWYPRDDVPGILGVAPRIWGLTGVLGVWILVIVILRRRRCDERSLFWAARTLPLAFFVLSTQMHERYLFPAIAIWVWSFRRSSRWWACWVLLSLCATINAMWVWAGPADSAWATWCREALHHPWLGMAPGVWCALALSAILLLALSGWIDTVQRRAPRP